MVDARDIARTGSWSRLSRADRRRQMVAFGTISGLLLLAFGFWFVVILTSSDRDQLEIAEGPSPAADPPVAENQEADEDEGDRTTGEDADLDEPDRQPTEVPTENRFGQEPETDPELDTDDRDDTQSTDDTDVERVTIDGVCTIELEASARDAAPLRAWEHADCAYAPVPLDDVGGRWIVVRASMLSGDVDAAAAQERARDLGVDGGVLWSSHYPSLNPAIWVAYDGPFADAEAARDAADAVEGEAYARALTTDEGDR